MVIHGIIANVLHDFRPFGTHGKGESDTMTIHVLRAAKHLGLQSNWKYSNLEYQKVIYIAHMFHLGAENEPLVSGEFEAWKYGPVHPELYRYLKVYGPLPVPRTFALFGQVRNLREGSESWWLDDAVEAFPPGSGARLVAITHREESAWTKHYEENRAGVVIPAESIIEEYEALQNG